MKSAAFAGIGNLIYANTDEILLFMIGIVLALKVKNCYYATRE